MPWPKQVCKIFSNFFFFSEKLDCSIGERSQAVYVEQERVGDYRGKLEAGNGSV